MPTYRYKKFLNAYFNPKIIHYTGGGHSKPWHKECRHDLKNEYAFYHYKSGVLKGTRWIRVLNVDMKLSVFTLPLVYIGRFIHQLKRFQ